MDIPAHLPKPKLCMLRKWETFNGYGFNLHSEKGKLGQFIGKVDPNSPADLGGLCAKDMLIEVNGINVEDSSHSMVVGRVKSIPDRVELFVCHKDTYQFSKEAGIKLSSAMLNIEEFTTPATQPSGSPVIERNDNNSSSSNTATDDSSAEAAAAAAAAASLRAAVEAAGGADFQEVKQEDLPVSLRNNEQLQQQQHQHQRSGPASSGEPSPRQSSKRDSSPPPSFTVSSQPPPPPPAAVAVASVAAAPAAASQPPKSSNPADPVAGVSLAEVRARIGQNKRNQVKMSSSTFGEKYSVFESL